MKRTMLGKTGYLISPVVFGGIINMNEEQQNANKFVSFAFDNGINYFDVAPSYGDAETKLGPALSPYRKDIFLACKTNRRDAAGSKEELLNSLKLLKTDYFDVYQFHGITTMEEVEEIFAPSGAMETFLWAHKEGYIRKIGFSTHNEDVALKTMDLFDFDSVLFPMNWAMGIVNGWGDRISKRVKETGAGLLAMKTLAHRLWQDGEVKIYPKSWCKPVYPSEEFALAAMKYGFYKGANTLVPPGDFEHFEFMLNNIDQCINNPLSADELVMLKHEGEKVKGQFIFPY